MLLSWLFSDWKIFPDGTKTIQNMIVNVIKGTLGIALVGVFVIFSVMFLNAVFGDWHGASALKIALQQNDPKILMDGLFMQNNSLVTIILMGIFMAMFMTMIPILIDTLFKNVNIENLTKFYDSVKKDVEIFWKNLKELRHTMKK